MNIEDPNALACIMYVSGVSDVFTSHVLDTPMPVCSPEGTNTMDVIGAFVSWSRRNPDVWNEDVFRGVVMALIERYGC